ncbi:prepilin peptidase [Agromyces sp. NPDC057679]|uniref:prepilin peptidase n=1 Tax=Agromyces sp. NPDC057679 TaxID=3346207 RepID=UPI00366E4F5C
MIAVPLTAFAILLIGLAVLAAADVATERVEWAPTILLAVLTVSALAVDGISLQQWVWGSLTAAAAFLFYLEMGVQGRFGGGDITLAPIPGLVLGAMNPLVGVWAFAVMLSVQGLLSVVARLKFKTAETRLPHVPAMFAGAIACLFMGFL